MMASNSDQKDGSPVVIPEVIDSSLHPFNRHDKIVSNADNSDKHVSKVVEEVSATSPTVTLEDGAHERWNHPRINLWRTLATFLGLFVMGLNDAAYGVCLHLPSFTDLY